MRYYDIDEINSRQKQNTWKLPLIATAVCLVFALTMTVIGINMAKNSHTASIQSENKQALDEASSIESNSALPASLRSLAVEQVIEDNSLKTYTIAQVRELDVSKPSGVTVSDLKLVTKGAFVGLEDAFYKAEQDYGINCLFLMAIGANESAYGTICFRKNNMFGFGRKDYPSKEANIDAVAKTLATKYLTPGASLYHGSTIDGVHKRYAASPVWDDHVAKYMVTFYNKIAPEHNKAVEKLKN